MPKLIRVTTVPMALKHLLAGQMRYMKEKGFEVIMVSADGKERQEIIVNEECEHHIIPMTRKITPFADLQSLWRLYHFFRREKPDIVHSHTPKAGLLAMMAAKAAGIKIRIHTIAGLRFITTTGLTKKILVAMERLTGSSATHVWPNSFSLFNYIRENKLVSESKLSVIGYGSSNGINLERFSTGTLDTEKLEAIKRQLAYDKNLIYLLCVGRIVKDKGVEELLAVFADLYREEKKLRLILLGSFENDLDPLSNPAKELLKTHPGIIHINWSDDVEYYMALSAMLIHPSHREGFPNVLLQAGAMNCPVLCSAIGGNIDIVDDKETGLIFGANNREQLANTVRFALQNPDLLKQYAIRLREKICKRFDRNFVWESLKNKYLELASASARTR